MNKHFIGLLASIFLVSALYDIQMGAIRTDGIYNNEFEMHYNIHNHGQEDLDNVRVTLWIPDIDYYDVLNTFDIQEGEHHGSFYHTKDLQPGMYFARVMAENDYSKDIRWIWLEVGQ